ncbi:MAG: hypothetical protein AB1489_34260 [Acidobacteriota bacterium]
MRKMIATAITLLGLVGALGTTSFAKPAKKIVKKIDAAVCPLKGTPKCPFDKSVTTQNKTVKNVPPCCVKKVVSAAK